MINYDEPFPKNYTSMCREDQDAWREKHMVKPVSTSMTVTQDMLLDLLEECRPRWSSPPGVLTVMRRWAR